jgi:hypothetical protein
MNKNNNNKREQILQPNSNGKIGKGNRFKNNPNLIEGGK